MSTRSLEQIAQVFGSIPKSIRKKEEVVPAFLSEEEFSLLPKCPRTGSMSSTSGWVKIGGRNTYPMTGALTSEEKQEYYKLKGTGDTTAKVVDGVAQMDAIISQLEAMSAPAGAMAAAKELKALFVAKEQQKKNDALVAQLKANGYTEEQIKNIQEMKK